MDPSPAPKAGDAAAQSNDWMSGATIYHVYVRSFQDSSGNGIGDLRGVLRRLPHVVSLGADAIWLSPFYVSPMEDMGYDIADHCAVDPLYGSLADFDELVSAAHGVGLKVLIDLVFSHTSDRHPWFEESMRERTNARADWYVWADPKPDGTPPNNWLSAFGGSAWTWNRLREQYYLHDFLPSQPSLDFSNMDVRRALLDIAEFWVARGVDGFRLDTLNSYFHDLDLRDNPPLPPEEAGDRPKANPFAQQLHVYDRAQRGDLAPLEAFVAAIEMMDVVTVVGEIGNRLKARDAQGLSRCYTHVLPRGTPEPAQLREAVLGAVEASPDGRVCWAFSNHDNARHVSRLARLGGGAGDDEARAKLAATLMACLPGAISLYQGEELGLDEAAIDRDQLRDPYGLRFWPEIRGRDGCRTPMPWDVAQPGCGFTAGEAWLPVVHDHVTRAVSVQADEAGSVLAHYRAVLAMRRESTALRQGNFAAIEAAGDVLAFTRSAAGETVFAAFNLGADNAGLELPDKLAAPERLMDGGAEVSGSRVQLPPLGFLVGKARA